MADGPVADPKIKISVEHQAALKAFLETGNATKDLSKAVEAMGKSIEASAGKVTASEKGYARFERTISQMASELKGNGATAQLNMLAAAVEKAGGKSALSAVQLDNLRSKIDALKAAGGTAPASLDSFAKVTAETNKLADAGKALAGGQGLSGALAAMSPGAIAATAAVAGLTGAVVALAANTIKTAEWAERMTNLSKATGLSVEKVQLLEYAAGQAGVSFEAAVKGAEKLEQKLGEDDEAFSRIGLDVEHLKTLAPEQLFDEVAKKVAGLTTQHERAAAAVALFGKAGVETYLPLIEQMADLEAQAKATNVVLSQDQLDALGRLDDAVDKLAGTWDGLKKQTAAWMADSPAVIAAIEGIAIAMGDVSGEIKGMPKLNGLLETILDFQIRFYQLRASIQSGLGTAFAAQVPHTQAMVADLQKQLAALRAGPAAGGDAEGGEGKPGYIPKGKISVPGLGIVDKADYEKMLAASEGYVHSRNEENEEVAKRNAESDQKDLADIAARATKAQQEQSAQLLDIKVMEAAKRRELSQQVAKDEVEAAAKGAAWLAERRDADAKLIAESQAVLARATAKETDSLRDKVDAIHAATEAATTNIRATEKTSEAAQEEAVANLKSAEAHQIAAEKAKAHQQALENLANNLGKVRQGFGELTQLFDQLGVSAESGLGKAARAGEQLAGAAESAVGAAASFATGDYIGAAVGAVSAISGIVGAIKTAFFKPEWKRVMEDVGREFGVSISQGLAETIAKDSKALGDRYAATLKNLGAIIKEAGGVQSFGIDKTTKSLRDLFAAVERGTLSIGDAGKVFDDVFSELGAAVTKNGQLASKQFLELIELSHRFGLESKAVTEYMNGQAQRGIAGLKLFLDNAKVSVAGAAEAIGSGIASAYAALLAEGKRPAEAFKELQPYIEKLRAQLEETGFSGGAAFALLESQAALFTDEVKGPALEGIHGLVELLVATHNQGLLTQDAFAGLAAQVTATSAALADQGVIGPAALSAMAPDLQKIWELQQDFGYSVDEGTQALLTQAEAQGVVGEAFRSAGEQILDVLKEIRDALLGLPDKDVNVRVRTSYETNGSPPGPPGDDGGRAPGDFPGFARGGFGDFGGGQLAMLHGNEAILPLDHPGDLGAVVSRLQASGYMRSATAPQEGGIDTEALAAALAGASQPINLHVEAHIGDDKLYDKLFRASQGRRFRVHQDAIVTGRR